MMDDFKTPTLTTAELPHTERGTASGRNAFIRPPAPDLDAVHVLLIDDQAMVAEAVRRMLATDNHITFVHSTRADAIVEQVLTYQPTVILLDLVMPDADGRDLIRSLRQHPETQDIPIIMLSSKEDSQLKADAFALGCNDYVVKLPDAVELVARVRSHARTYIHLQQRDQAYQLVQQTQMQLIQSEKMSHLGQLMTGIISEISNPINFISGNIKPATEYVQDLFELVETYQTVYPKPAPEVQAKLEAVDLPFVQADLPKLLNSIQSGASRIRQLLFSLQDFSGKTAGEKRMINLHHSLDSLLRLQNYRFKPRANGSSIRVVRRYDRLPMLECFASELNQALMQLIMQAIDLLEARFSSGNPQPLPPTGELLIQTDAIAPNRVRITVSITGIGDSFPGATDSNLPISCRLGIKKHQGSLSHQATAAGVQWFVELPIRQNQPIPAT
jgi:two-component system NtrC family sensor kinase